MDLTGRQDRGTGHGFTERARPRWGLIALIVLAHIAVGFGLARALAPDFTRRIIANATRTVTVFVTTPTPTAEPTPRPREGAAARQAKKARPRPVAAPKPKIPLPQPSLAPPVASIGTADSSGARDKGSGTGAHGEGQGTGSGQEGNGMGDAPVTAPIKIAGNIRSAADYPPPPGGRQTRFGQSVIIYMRVGIHGRASDCRVVKPSNDPEADRITCELAVKRFRFKPAQDANGNPVPSTYGWEQRFFRKR